ncbi:unnamed protein product [Cylindrotheca closterium]|uniref:Large ribosomal subunit protein bL25 L25 domain-containing protein n=1 Tax=Cylindrotheca closterium TaxID=2856 RepID=A0AAD2JIR2_9STRA|nr:unnamed protein product [Cylindrotheca closterium]
MSRIRSYSLISRLISVQRPITFQGGSRCSNRALSSAYKVEDVSQLVSGLTQEAVDADPKVAAFLEANFESSEDTASDGFIIPDEVLEQLGVADIDIPEKKGKGSEYGAPRVDKGLGNEAQQALNIRTLQSYIREEEGSNACRRLRYAKMIPGMLYGSDPNLGVLSNTPESKTMLKTPWPTLQRELDRFHRRFESRVYDLTVFEDESDTEGTVHRVVPRNVQRHPVQGSIYCANFVRYFPGRPLKIPIVFANTEESLALRRDGFIIPVSKHIECLVEEGAPIPEQIELDCTGVVLKDVLRMDRLIFPDGVTASKRVDSEKFVVGPVVGGRGGSQEDDEDDDAAGGDEESSG